MVRSQQRVVELHTGIEWEAGDRRYFADLHPFTHFSPFGALLEMAALYSVATLDVPTLSTV
jgi:hypothetical protein